MVTAAQSLTYVEGIVQRVNERGLLLVGESAWRNLSKYADGSPQVAVGERVRLSIDSRDFVRAVVTFPEPASSTRVESPAQAPERPENGTPSRDQQIARMNALTNAVGILCTGGVVEPADVLTLAATLEGWILR